MSRSHEKSQSVRRAAQYRNGGEISKLAQDLDDLVRSFRFESALWSGDEAERIWTDAWTIDAVRLALVLGRTTPLDAEQWLIAGRKVLEHFRDTRSAVGPVPFREQL